MIGCYTRMRLQAHPNLLRTMHEDRKRVFVDTLHWELEFDSGMEQDEFDNAAATYLVGRTSDDTHWVSVRLLDTERPHILGSIFPYLCEGEVPIGPNIKEITRYIASPRVAASQRLLARNVMARSLIEYGHLHGITTYTAVCDIAFLSQILAAGWRCDPLGLPREVNGSIIGAFCIYVDADTISKMTGSWRYLKPALDVTSLHFQQAA
jgi:N-acyl-L-homoserine lactone synthetase